MARRKKAEDWEDIGQMVGKKVDMEKDNWKSSWKDRWKRDSCGCQGCNCHRHDSGFVGRLFFIVGVWILLDQLGLLQQVNIWVKLLIVVGFTLMKF